MKILFWVVLILFTIVKSKIVHYSSLCYFPMTFLAALSFRQLLDRKIAFNNWMRAGLGIIGGIYVAACLAVPYIGKHINLIKPLFQKDKFALANLEANVHWSYWHFIPGLFLLAVLIIALLHFNRTRYESGITWLLGGIPVFVMLTLIFFINNIEAYSQRAAVSFCQERIGEDCYVTAKGYKTYVPLFYTRKAPVSNENYYNQEWLLTGAIDKPVYVITKVDKLDQLRPYPQLKKIGEKNGFVFFKREVP